MSSGSDSVYASLGKTDALLHEPFHLRQSSASVIQTLLKQSIQSKNLSTMF